LAILGKLLRLFGYVASAGLCVFLIGMSLVVLLSESGTFAVELVPWWTGRELAKWLLGAGLFGLLASALAASGRFPILQLVWTAAVFGTLAYGYYWSNYKWDDYDGFRSSLNMTGAAFTALMGAVTGMFARRLPAAQK